MTFDPVKQFIDAKRAFAEVRGSALGGGGSGYYPLTTTLDAFTFSRDFFEATQKSEDGAIEKGFQELARSWGAGPTDSYRKAVAAWKATWPSVFEAAGKPAEAYWNNLAFLDAGSKYSIARSAVGSVPGHFSLFVEAVKESALDVLHAVTPRINWWKWGAYGLAGYFAYQALKGAGGRAKKLGAGG